MSSGARIHFDDNIGRVENAEGALLFEAELSTKENQFIINTMDPAYSSQLSAHAAKAEKASMALWHERLGHPSYDTVKKMAITVEGMKITEGSQKPDEPCRGCQEGKAIETRFLQRSHALRNRSTWYVSTLPDQ